MFWRDAERWLGAQGGTGAGEVWVARERKLRRWQEEWEGGTTGRWLFGLAGRVSQQGVPLSWKGRQLCVGHGNFKGYLVRFGLSGGNGECPCGGGVEDARHVLLECGLPARRVAREALREGLRAGGLGFPPNLDVGEDRGRVGVVAGLANSFAEIAIEDDQY